MKHKSTLLLVIAVAVAGTVAYSLSKKPTSEDLQKLRTRLLADMRSSSIATLAIRAGDQRLACAREAGEEGWRITEPTDLRADRWAVEGILDKLELAEKASSTFPEGRVELDLAQYGLAEPVRTITLGEEAPGRRSWTLLVGKETGVADTVYVAVEGEDAVYAVKKDVADKTNVTLADLRSKDLAPRISTLDMVKLTISAAKLDEKPAFELACEKAAGKWELKQPVHDLADRTKVAGVANKLYDHRVGKGEFAVDDPSKAADYGLDEPALTVTVEGKDKTQTFVFSRRQDGDKAHYYAMHKGELPIAEVPETLFNDLRADVGELRERSLADFTVSDVAEVAIAGAGGELVLKKQDQQWQIAADTPIAADAGVADEMLRGLKDAEVDEFVADEPEDLGGYGLTEQARTRVSLKDKDGGTLAEVVLGSADEAGERVYAQRPPYPPVLALQKAAFLDNIEGGRLAFLDRLVLEEPSDDAREVSLDHAGSHFKCTFEPEAGEWQLAEPVSGKADEVAVRAIVGDFAHLQADAFAAEQADDLALFGLADPAAKATVTYRAESKAPAKEGGEAEAAPPRHTLLLGAETKTPAEGRFAKLAEGERVFVLPDYIAGHFLADLASRRISVALKPTAVTFTMGDASLRFLYDAEKDAWTDADGKELPEPSAAAVGKAVRLLGRFDGAGVADYVAKEPAAYGFDKPCLVVELQDELGQAKKVLIGAETAGGDRYAKGFVSDFVLIAAKADVDTLQAVMERPAESTEQPASEGGESGAGQ